MNTILRIRNLQLSTNKSDRGIKEHTLEKYICRICVYLLFYSL